MIYWRNCIMEYIAGTDIIMLLNFTQLLGFDWMMKAVKNLEHFYCSIFIVILIILQMVKNGK